MNYSFYGLVGLVAGAILGSFYEPGKEHTGTLFILEVIIPKSLCKNPFFIAANEVIKQDNQQPETS